MVCAVTRGRVEWGAWLNPTGFRVIEARFPSALIAESFYFRAVTLVESGTHTMDRLT